MEPQLASDGLQFLTNPPMLQSLDPGSLTGKQQCYHTHILFMMQNGVN